MYKGHLFYHFVCLNTYTKNLEVQIHVHTSFLPMYKVYIYKCYMYWWWYSTCTRLLEIMVLKRLIFITFIIWQCEMQNFRNKYILKSIQFGNLLNITPRPRWKIKNKDFLTSPKWRAATIRMTAAAITIKIPYLCDKTSYTLFCITFLKFFSIIKLVITRVTFSWELPSLICKALWDTQNYATRVSVCRHNRTCDSYLLI